MRGNFVCDGGDGFVCMQGKKDKREGGGDRNGCSGHCVRKMRKEGELGQMCAVERVHEG